MGNMLFGDVTTSNIKGDGTYELTVKSNISNISYKNCNFIQQPGINTMPNVGDTVLLLIVRQGEYAVIGVTSYFAKPGIEIKDKNITMTGTTISSNATSISNIATLISSSATDINSIGGNVTMIGSTITANGEDLTIDNV